jgi:aminoglycoside phosphotransferase (APT) family kinase protein
VAAYSLSPLNRDLSVAARLEPWLAERLGTPSVEIDDFNHHDEGFSWRTYTLDARWTGSDGSLRTAGFAVRVEPEDGLLAPYDIRRQFALHQLIAGDSTVPIPELRWLELDPSYLGMPFYVMDRVRGVVPVQWLPNDPEVFPSPEARRQLGLRFVDVQAQIHSIDWRRDGGGLIEDPGDPEQAALDEVERWVRHYEEARLVELPLVRESIVWLRRNVACSGRIVICHGDYRIGNFIVRDGEIVAVLDWELAHVSDPVEDIAYSGLPLFRGRSPLLSRLLEPDEYFARYETRTGLRVDDEVFRFWTVLGLLKATASHVKACRAFEDGRVGDLRLAAMDHLTVYVLRHLAEALESVVRG